MRLQFCSGDSRDGIQLTGQFTDTAALVGNDISTFQISLQRLELHRELLLEFQDSKYTLVVSSFYTPGDNADVLVVMNAAALKSNLHSLKKGGIVIANIDGFDKKNLRLAKYDEGLIL